MRHQPHSTAARYYWWRYVRRTRRGQADGTTRVDAELWHLQPNDCRQWMVKLLSRVSSIEGDSASEIKHSGSNTEQERSDCTYQNKASLVHIVAALLSVLLPRYSCIKPVTAVTRRQLGKLLATWCHWYRGIESALSVRRKNWDWTALSERRLLPFRYSDY